MTSRNEILAHLFVVQGDITTIDVDAIVNAANPSLLGGGGVDGAIHKAAGPGLLAECRKLGGAGFGEARITGGHNLKARHVIHTPGPIYRDGRSGERELLRNSYRNCMDLARTGGLRSIAFPALSTGVYGYPKQEACETAVQTVVGYMDEHGYLPDVHFVLFDRDSFDRYREYILELGR